MLDLKFYPEIKEGSKVVLPISMGNLGFTFKVMSSLIEALEGHAITVLVCDYLNRHNVGEEEAIKQGDAFLERNRALLEADNIEVIRWKPWIQAHQGDYDVAYEKILRLSADGSDLQRAMRTTARKKKKKATTENEIKASINYQREEYAVIDCMKEYDQLVYIAPITYGMGVFYKHADITCPEYVHCKVKTPSPCLQALRETEVEASLLTEVNQHSAGFFLPAAQQKVKPKALSFGYQACLNQVEEILFSSQVSTSEKKAIAEYLQRLVYQAEIQFKGEATSSNSMINQKR